MAKVNKKLLARTRGTTKGEVRGVIHEGTLSDVRALAVGGPRAGVKRGSAPARRATKMVRKAQSTGAARLRSKRV